MPKDFARSRRVSEQIQRELANLIQMEINDPRVGMVTVSAVDVSRDLSHAKVFVTTLTVAGNTDQDTAVEAKSEPTTHKASIDALQHAAGFLQHELGKRMKLRIMPQLRFIYDESIERGTDLSALIDSAVQSDQNNED